MKTGFKEPNAVKKQTPKDAKMEGARKDAYDFKMPSYDERTSCYFRNGTDYGTGVNQPVGHQSAAKLHVPAMPMGRVNTMSLYGED
jgi:hypothetical protein